MSHEVFIVEFSDGLRMYGVNDGMACHMHSFLFKTHNEATGWIFCGDRDSRRILDEPDNASLTEEDVIVDPDEPWSFRSRASRSAKWLTGPCINEDALEKWEDNEVYGR